MKVISVKSKPKKRRRKSKQKKAKAISVLPSAAVPSSTKQQGELEEAVLNRPDEHRNCSKNLQQSAEEGDDIEQTGKQDSDDNDTKYGHDDFPLVCDFNNNQYYPSLPTIIDVGEYDTSGENYLVTQEALENANHILKQESFEDFPVTMNIKHPLEHEWTFWYSPFRNRTWEENLKIIKTVATIEDFWAVVNWIEPPSNLLSGADYSLFKTGINPDWDDLSNRSGGRWVVNCSRQGVDKDWMEVSMAMVGQQFGEGQDMMVTGAVVSVRNRGDKVAVWVREVVDSEKIGERMAKVVGSNVAFKVHKK